VVFQKNGRMELFRSAERLLKMDVFINDASEMPQHLRPKA
jgi:CCR4-NOT transcriptional regulation complex NOT5 subunit